MRDTKQSASGGIGFCGLLTIVFITLKLVKVIDWSWVWVLAPIWIPVAFGLFFILLALSIKLFLLRGK